MHFSCRQQHRIKISSPSHLRKVRNEAKWLYFTNDPNISHQNLYSQSIPNNGRCIKISVAGVNQKPNYNGLKFSEPFTKLELCSVKGSEHFQRLYLAFCLTPSIQISTKYPWRCKDWIQKFWSDINTYIPFYTDDPLPSRFKSQRINSTSMAGYFTLKLAVFTSVHT